MHRPYAARSFEKQIVDDVDGNLRSSVLQRSRHPVSSASEGRTSFGKRHRYTTYLLLSRAAPPT